MAFFKRELGPVERFEIALKEKLAARQKLAGRLSISEKELEEKRAAAERLAVAGAANARLDRAEANMRAVEARTKALRAALAELDDQVTAADLVLNSSFDTASAQAVVDQYDAWTAYQAAAQKASDSFAAASVSYRGSTDLSKVRATVDGVVAQKGLDTSSLCAASTASAQ